MTALRSSLFVAIEQRAALVGAEISWSFSDLITGDSLDARGDISVPVGDQEGLIQYLALADACTAVEVDLDRKYVLHDKHRDDGHNDVIGCMSSGLVLSLEDYLTQTVITGDLAAYAVVRDALVEQGILVSEVVDHYLTVHGAGSILRRPAISEPGPTGVRIGSTTTNEQLELLRAVLRSCNSSDASGVLASMAPKRLAVLTSVLASDGLVRGLPAYGPFTTQIAHSARIEKRRQGAVRSDAAIYYHMGVPRFLVGVCVHGIEEWRGDLPGMARADDFLRDLSRICWGRAVGSM